MPKDTIAFVSTYFHPSRDSIERMLRDTFPDYRLENISTLDVVKRHKNWVVPNLLYVLKEYGGSLLGGRGTVREHYFLTTYLFRKLREAMREYIDPARHAFSFSTQSLYDIGVPGVPHFIYTDHTHLTNLASPYFDRRLLRPPEWIALERTVYHNATRVFTRSTNVSADVERHYGVPSEQVACVYAGSNVPHLKQTLDEARYDAKRILFVGGDWERKGGPVLAKAFHRVLETYPDARLTIVGATPQLDLPNCDVLGNLPLEQVGHHYAQASVFCLPTRLEPFGIAFLEAMNYGLPIVATAVGAVPDMVEPGVNGRLVAPGDADALAAELIDLLGNANLCRRYGESSRRRILDKYNWTRVGERIREQVQPFLTP
jgi:glycosyltransferase involved in cell wall biosynthesis